MKTISLSKFLKRTTLVLSVLLLINLVCHAQPDFSFRTYSKESGKDREPGSSYRFFNVKPGYDAIVTYVSAVNGATLDTLDQVGSGFQEGFQPLVRVPAHKNGYLVFQISFVVTLTNTSATLPVVNHTAIDVDGHQLPGDSLYEWEAVNMGNGSVIDYMGINPAVSVTQQGQWITGKNVEGVEYNLIDTMAKNAMFTVTNKNISQYQLRVGVDNRSGSDVSRQRSAYFKKFAFTSSVLPVTLTSFTASLNNNSKVDLTWTTATEMNLSHFVVEKSIDGINYTDKGIVFAMGNTTEKQTYKMNDNIGNDRAQVIYYRLRSIDLDGKSQLSETRIIRVGKGNTDQVSILTYPNPVSNEVRITVPAEWQNKKVTYEIFNLNGQTMKKTEVANSSQTQAMSLLNFAPGFYSVRATCEGQSAVQKIIKQ